jgi:hypothetical protein
MVLSPSQWVRQPFYRVPYTSSATSEGGVKIQSFKQPTYSIYATLPEEDQVMNLLELSEDEQLLQFHISSLKAYRAISSHCNESITRKVGVILDSEQLLHCLKLRGMHYSLWAAYIELFNTLHLDPEVHNKLVTRGEFILPLSTCSHSVPLFLPTPKLAPRMGFRRRAAAETPAGEDQAHSNQAAVAHNVRSCLGNGEEGRLSFSVRELKEMVFYNLEKLLSIK